MSFAIRLNGTSGIVTTLDAKHATRADAERSLARMKLMSASPMFHTREIVEVVDPRAGRIVRH